MSHGEGVMKGIADMLVDRDMKIAELTADRDTWKKLAEGFGRAAIGLTESGSDLDAYESAYDELREALEAFDAVQEGRGA